MFKTAYGKMEQFPLVLFHMVELDTQVKFCVLL